MSCKEWSCDELRKDRVTNSMFASVGVLGVLKRTIILKMRRRPRFQRARRPGTFATATVYLAIGVTQHSLVCASSARWRRSTLNGPLSYSTAG